MAHSITARTTRKALASALLVIALAVAECSESDPGLTVTARTGDPATGRLFGDRTRGAGERQPAAHHRPPAAAGHLRRRPHHLQLDLRHRRQLPGRVGQRVRPGRPPPEGRLARHRVRARHHRCAVGLCALVVTEPAGCCRRGPGPGHPRLHDGGAGLPGAGHHRRLPPLPGCHHGRLQHGRRGQCGPQAGARLVGAMGRVRGVPGRPGGVGRQRVDRRLRRARTPG